MIRPRACTLQRLIAIGDDLVLVDALEIFVQGSPSAGRVSKHDLDGRGLGVVEGPVVVRRGFFSQGQRTGGQPGDVLGAPSREGLI